MKNLIQKIGRMAVPLALVGAVGSALYAQPNIERQRGYVDVKNPAFVKDGMLYTVGSSGVYSSERGARDNAYMNAILKDNEISGESARGVLPIANEIDTTEVNGQQDYVAEVMTQVPISSFDTKGQANIKQKDLDISSKYVRVGDYLVDPKVMSVLKDYFGVYATHESRTTTNTVNGKTQTNTEVTDSQKSAIDGGRLEGMLKMFDVSNDKVITPEGMSYLAKNKGN